MAEDTAVDTCFVCKQEQEGSIVLSADRRNVFVCLKCQRDLPRKLPRGYSAFSWMVTTSQQLMTETVKGFSASNPSQHWLMMKSHFASGIFDCMRVLGITMEELGEASQDPDHYEWWVEEEWENAPKDEPLIVVHDEDF